MTVVLDKGDLLKICDEAPLAPASAAARAADAVPLEIGLLNNMPDGALAATERQYIRLFEVAGGDYLVRLHFFSLPAVTRSAETRARLDAVYHEIAKLKHTKLDGLIVTGAEPKTELLRQ